MYLSKCLIINKKHDNKFKIEECNINIFITNLIPNSIKHIQHHILNFIKMLKIYNIIGNLTFNIADEWKYTYTSISLIIINIITFN